MLSVRVLMVLLAVMAAGQVPTRVPVVVELFTSEGCSSCPPADALLTKLAKEQPIPGVQVIPLGMHVTYWDQLGWKDAASLPLATERQQRYRRMFGEDRIYTPQAVIDGRDETIGSDETAIVKAARKAAGEPHIHIDLQASIDGGRLAATANLGEIPPGVKEPLEAWLAIAEDGLSSDVRRGENTGRTLRHDAVVCAIFGSDVGAARLLGFRGDLRPQWRRERLSAVVVLQGKRSQRIWGAAAVALR